MVYTLQLYEVYMGCLFQEEGLPFINFRDAVFISSCRTHAILSEPPKKVELQPILKNYNYLLSIQ